MKKIIEILSKKLEDSKNFLHDKKNISTKQLIKIKKSLSDEFEKSINFLDNKKNLIAEAIRQRLRLKKFKISVWRMLFPMKLRIVLGAPFIYGMFIPLVFIDLCLEIYHNVCFRLYGIPLVRRRDHIIIDRHLLSYLNWIEKINCVYCGYFNGFVSYAREIGGRTERYWCPIKHARRRAGAHEHYDKFFDYLEGERYRECRKELRVFEEEKK